MSELTQPENKIVLKSNPIFLGIGIVAMFMAVMGIRLTLSLLPLQDGYTFADIFGLIFVSIWTLIVLGMCLCTLIMYSKQIKIDDEGVSCRIGFAKKNLNWYEIEDYGLSYCGQTKGEGNTYYLYFSKEKHPIKNECKKKLKGKMIKFVVMGNDYEEIAQKVIPFCTLRTQVEPFIGKDKYHFL